jgi:hypothetical protein
MVKRYWHINFQAQPPKPPPQRTRRPNAVHIRGAYRRSQAIGLRNEHPDWSLTKIGVIVGLSRERVRQILAKAKLPTRQPRPMRKCSNSRCSDTVPLYGRSAYCSSQCKSEAKQLRKESSEVLVQCSMCLSQFTVPRSIYRRQTGITCNRGRYTGRFFCNRQCFCAFVKLHCGEGKAALWKT